MIPPTVAPDRRGLLHAWLLCGVLDINAAFLSAWLTADRTPLWVLRAVAGALLGKASFDAGPWVGVLGLGLRGRFTGRGSTCS